MRLVKDCYDFDLFLEQAEMLRCRNSRHHTQESLGGQGIHSATITLSSFDIDPCPCGVYLMQSCPNLGSIGAGSRTHSRPCPIHKLSNVGLDDCIAPVRVDRR